MQKLLHQDFPLTPRALNLATLGGKFRRSHLQSHNFDQSHLLVNTGDGWAEIPSQSMPVVMFSRTVLRERTEEEKWQSYLILTQETDQMQPYKQHQPSGNPERDVNSLLCSVNSIEGLEWNHSSFSWESTSRAWTVNLKARKCIASDVLFLPQGSWLPSLGSALVVKELPLPCLPSSAKHTLAILVSLPSVWTVLQTGNMSQQITVASSWSYHIM